MLILRRDLPHFETRSFGGAICGDVDFTSKMFALHAYEITLGAAAAKAKFGFLPPLHYRATKRCSNSLLIK
jgi:hypothetical protein